VTSKIENEDGGVADRAADYLCVDREVCRRASYGEPEERVQEVVRWVLSEQDLPEHDSERMIERWARDHGAGIYSRDCRRGGFEQVEDILARAVSGRDTAA
jgi:hypothetical protein